MFSLRYSLETCNTDSCQASAESFVTPELLGESPWPKLPLLVLLSLVPFEELPAGAILLSGQEIPSSINLCLPYSLFFRFHCTYATA